MILQPNKEERIIKFNELYRSLSPELQGWLTEIIVAVSREEPLEAEIEGGTTWWYVCGDCHTAIDKRDRYCRECGRRIKWDGGN